LSWIFILIALIAGFGLGLLVAYAVGLWRSASTREITAEVAAEIMRESDARRQAELDKILGGVKASFGDMSLEALSRSTDEFMKLAKSTLVLEREAGAKDLGEKKTLIDQQLIEMTSKLENVTTLMNRLERDREQKFGEISQHLKLAHDQYTALSQSTNSLREALASTKARGQWGERMAEDVLRMAGFVEKINYVKQKATSEGKIPDFTFFLPKNLVLNMDAKFPLDNYMRYLEADNDTEKERYCKAFLRDVKARVKEIRGREYINPSGGTVDYVILFIPNEQIYAFIHEMDSSILDDAIREKVVFCSPVTLFAVLAVIRQAVENFSLEETSNEILELIGSFKKQWELYQKSVETLGTRLDSVHKAYDDMTGVRKRQLEKPLAKMDEIRAERGLPMAPDENVVLPPNAAFAKIETREIAEDDTATVEAETRGELEEKGAV